MFNTDKSVVAGYPAFCSSFAESPSHLLNALIEVGTYAPFTTYLKTFFSQITDPQQAALDLAESYAWNFHGVGGPHAAPLYASVYLSERGVTHQQVERELRKTLNGHGLCLENSDKEPFDHLSVILEFVAWLDEQGAKVQAQEMQQKFIKKYLLSWLPAFVSRCNRADRFGFYSALAVVTLAFVETDFRQFESV